jgi:phage protein D
MSVRAQVKVGPFGAPAEVPLQPMVENAMRRVVVDTHVHLPDMFEVTFNDEGGVLANNMIDIGTSVKIWGGADDSSEAPLLIDGEVTAIEAEIDGNVCYTTVRGYEKAHRMQRVRRTYVYRNMKDSDIAQQMALKYGLVTAPPQIDSTTGVHDAVAQFNQTDWEFLKCRAAENGFDFGVVQGAFVFRKPKATGDTPMIAGLFPLPGGPPELTAGDNLLRFRPRVTGASQVPKVMVRAWDSSNKEAIVSREDADTKQVDLDDIDGASDLYDKFMLPPRIPDIPIPVLIPGTGASIDWGVKEALPTSVNGDVYAVVNRPLGSTSEADGMAKSLAEHVGSTFAEAEGTCAGNPLVQAGVTVKIKNTPGYFSGKWVVTNARHVFDEDDPFESYITQFIVSGRQERSLLGLASMGQSNAGAATPPRIEGVVPAIVVDNNDPNSEGRVRLAFPWLADNYVSDWCRVMQVGMGKKGGWMLIFEPDDEVLAAFEFGDIRRPYVVGGLSNPKDSKKVPIPSVTMGKVAERGFYSRDGHKLVFTEDPTPDPTDAIPKQKTGMRIEDKDGKLTINLDMKQPVGKKIEIQVNGAAGGCTLSMDDMGAITIESTTPGAGQISLKAASISIEAQQQLQLKGAMVSLESTGPATVKGNPLGLN